MNSLTLSRQSSALEEVSLTSEIRAFIAQHLSVDVEIITANSHFSDDLGLDVLDVVELTILLEDQFKKGCIKDEAVQMEFVGDLICHLNAIIHPPGPANFSEKHN